MTMFHWREEENTSIMKKSDIAKYFYNALKCKIYILGSSSAGESILFVVYGDDQPIYSCITDSFKIGNENIPITITDRCGLDHITDIFWTHPHDDHSEGLVELIEKYKPENIYIPADLQQLPDCSPELSKKVLEKINTYHSCDARYAYQPCVIDVGSNYLVLDKSLNVGGKKVPMSIYTLAPAIGKTRRDAITQNYNSLNDFSIAISIVVGDFSLLLTGDMQDQTVKYISNDLQREIITPNLLKIPHHGSRGSLSIISLFDANTTIDVAVSTAKRASHLPRKDALDFYSSRCCRVYKICDDAESAGIWGVEIDILNATITELELQNYVAHITSS